LLHVNDNFLSAERGQTFCIMGFSGSGKSTLIRLLNRLIEPMTSGKVEVLQRMATGELRFFLAPDRDGISKWGAASEPGRYLKRCATIRDPWH